MVAPGGVTNRFLFCRWDKTRRASSDKDKPEDITRGEAYHNHGLRKVSANAAVCGIDDTQPCYVSLVMQIANC
jgi:hypothetical protein